MEGDPSDSVLASTVPTRHAVVHCFAFPGTTRTDAGGGVDSLRTASPYAANTGAGIDIGTAADSALEGGVGDEWTVGLKLGARRSVTVSPTTWLPWLARSSATRFVLGTACSWCECGCVEADAVPVPVPVPVDTLSRQRGEGDSRSAASSSAEGRERI